METRDILLCGGCGQIASYGYADGIDKHKERVLEVEAVLNHKEYFAESYTTHHDEWTNCEVCRVTCGVIHRHTIIRGS